MESLKSKLFRWSFYLFPAYRGTGGRVTYIRDDFHEIHIKIPLNWRTRNYVGTIFGGSMLGASDPFYMLMLIKILGKEYVVWDKAAAIRFKRPGKNRLTAKFIISPEEVAEIKKQVEEAGERDFVFTTQMIDKEEQLCAELERTVYVAKKEFYEQKLEKRKNRKILKSKINLMKN